MAVTNPLIRLVLFAGALAIALVTGFGVGRITGPPATAQPAAGADHSHAPGTGAHEHPAGHADGHGAATGGATADAATGVGGLAVSSAGYTLAAQNTTFRPGVAAPLRFHITGRDGRPVTSYAVAHEKQLHLVVVRRDLTGYQHLHPTMAPDGTWSIDLRLPSAGQWRAYADFVATDAGGSTTPATLGVDLVVAGDYAPQALPADARQGTVDGFTAGYEGTGKVGTTQPLLFRVTGADGQPATLQPYLGAYGHLVMLREGDLGYVHVHPEHELNGGAVKFWLAAPSPGRYRLFLDFQVAGTVRTAEFTMSVS